VINSWSSHCIPQRLKGMTTMSTLQREILRLAEVKRRTGLPTSTIYKKIGDREFPRQVPIGFRTVGWLSDEVDGWIAKQVAKRDQATP
jgi:prophage regulatory protein